MHVLVTRPLADAHRTAAQLVRMGHNAVLSPVIEIAATGAAIPDISPEMVIATSSHAFACLAEGDPKIPALRTLPLCVVGARTARAAVKCRFPAPDHVAENAAALAVYVAQQFPEKGGVLYLAGADRKPHLETTLAQAGLRVGVVEVYRATAVAGFSAEAAGMLRRREIHAVLHFSRRSAHIFASLALAEGIAGVCTALRHLCLSEDVAAGLAALGASTIEVAAKPSSKALINMLR